MRTSRDGWSIALRGAAFYAAAAAFLPSVSFADGMVAPPPPVTAGDRADRVAGAATAIARYPAMFEQCYARSPGSRPDPVDIRFQLRADGRAHAVRLSRNDSGNATLARCLRAAIGRFQWTPSRIPSVAVTHRFTRPSGAIALIPIAPAAPPRADTRTERTPPSDPTVGCAAATPDGSTARTACARLPPHLAERLRAR
jgi:hypothetical protein